MTRILIHVMRPFTLCSFVLLFQQFTCQGQLLRGIPYVHQYEADSLKKIIKTTVSGSEKVSALIRLGSLYFHNPYPKYPNLKSAMKLANEAAAISTREGLRKSYDDAEFLVANIYLRKLWPDSAALVLPKVNDSTRVKILLGMSHIYRQLAFEDNNLSLKKAMAVTLQAQAIGQKIHDTLLSIMVRREIACIHSDTDEPNSKNELLEIIRLFKGIGYPYLQSTYYELRGTEALEGNEDKELYYSEMTLHAMTESGDSLGATDWLLAHANILRRTGQHEKSLLYCLQAIELFKTRYGDVNIAFAVRFIAEALVKLNRQSQLIEILPKISKEYPPSDTRDSLALFQDLGASYRLLKDYGKAESYFKRELAIRNRMHYKPNYYSLGQLYVESGNFKEARYYLYKALPLVNGTSPIRQKSHLQYCLFLADSATGHLLSAIQHLSQNKRYDDTILKQSKVQAIEKYKAQFDTEKKEADLKLKDQRISLLTKEQQLKEMDLKRTKFFKNTAIIGGLIMLGVGILFFRLYRQKKKDRDMIARINEQLKDMLAEKEWWLKEVHHRVKNNLHTIICLLESQAMYLEKDALQAVEKSQHRIYAMSLIHQKLYQNENLRSIDMSIYLDEFIGYLKDSFETEKIEFITNVQPVQLNLQQAIPVALIINEGVTNSIKYAFDHEGAPRIWISMTETDHLVKLLIADSGKGFEQKEETNSLGLQLIKGLSKELRGTIQIESGKGTRITIEFKKDSITEHMPVLEED